jgi:hypothetical protein
MLTTLFKEIEDNSEIINLLRTRNKIQHFNNRDNKKELLLFYQN